MASKTKLYLYLILGSSLLSGCHYFDKAEESKAEYYEVAVKKQGLDFKIPSLAWDLLVPASAEATGHEESPAHGAAAPAAHGAPPEKPAHGAPPAAEHGGGGGEAAGGAGDSMASSYQYAPVEVFLEEKTPGVLREPRIRIQFLEGGGEVDLSQWVTERPGSFYVRFGVAAAVGPSEESGISEMKSLFYSRTKKRKVGDDIVGTGCQKLLDLTGFLGDQLEKSFVVNSSRGFHSTVLGGHFLFSFKKNADLKVTRVTFTDSKKPQYFCEN